MHRLYEVPVDGDVTDKSFAFPDSYSEADTIISRIYSDFSRKNDDGTEKPADYEYNNIVAIIGARGSGKTSFLLSLIKAIKNVKKYPYNEILVLNPILEPRFFSPNHSIARLLVSKLYTLFKKDYASFDDEGLKKDLISDFSSVNSVIEYSENTNDHDNDSINGDLDSLDKLGGIFDIKSSLTKLISDFVIFENKISKTSYKSLAIFIDDLDLESQNAYSIIDDISKYLKIRNLFVFLAYDNQTMINLITNKIMYSLNPKGVFPLFVEDDSEINERSIRFIEKLVPADCSIYLKSKVDYSEFLNVILSVLSFEKIEYDDDNSKECYKKYGIFADILLGHGGLRHINQKLNLLCGNVDKLLNIGLDKISDKDRLEFIDNLISNLPNLFELSPDTVSEDFDYSDPSHYTIYGNKTIGDYIAFYKEIKIIRAYCFDRSNHAKPERFSNFISSGDSSNGAPFEFVLYPEKGLSPALSSPSQLSSLSLSNESTMISYGDHSLNPLEFFSLLSDINSLPNDNHLALVNYCQAFSLFYPNTYSKLESSTSSKTILTLTQIIAFKKQKSGAEIFMTIKDLLAHLSRSRAKADLKLLRDAISNGLRKKIFVPFEADAKRAIADINNALKIPSTDSTYKASVSSIVKNVKSLVNS